MVRRRNAMAPMNSDFSVSPEKSKISFKTTTSQLTFDPHSPPCTIGLTKIRIHKIPIKSEKSTSSSSERSSPTNNNNHGGGGQYTPYSSNLYSVSKRSRQYASCRSAAWFFDAIILTHKREKLRDSLLYRCQFNDTNCCPVCNICIDILWISVLFTKQTKNSSLKCDFWNIFYLCLSEF